MKENRAPIGGADGVLKPGMQRVFDGVTMPGN